MALIICPECGGKVSDKANACIHCGYPLTVEQYSFGKSVNLLDKMDDAIQRLQEEVSSKRTQWENIRLPSDSIFF